MAHKKKPMQKSKEKMGEEKPMKSAKEKGSMKPAKKKDCGY